MGLRNLSLGLFFLFGRLFSFGQTKDFDKTIKVDNQSRQYFVHLPPSFDGIKKLPIIFAFHGSGGDYRTTIRHYNLNGLADAQGFIVVYPNALDKNWDLHGIGGRGARSNGPVNDFKFISNLLDRLILDYNVDSTRVFCTGMSRGAVFALCLAWQLSGRIKGIASVCASIPNAFANAFSFKYPTAVLLINGTSDPIINYEGGAGNANSPYAGAQQLNMMATEDLVKKIQALDNCSSVPVVNHLPDNDPNDGCQAIQYDYPCEATKIEFIKVVGGGHTWPGGFQYLPKSLIGNICNDFSASEKIFEFFSKIK